mmetsp:Transcript_25610/g.81275  ORF Transcript_25610/g.81275 Transcript_25610/m.81275 type:complete len:210 (+) Transcript_25610:1824-2453(+)
MQLDRSALGGVSGGRAGPRRPLARGGAAGVGGGDAGPRPGGVLAIGLGGGCRALEQRRDDPRGRGRLKAGRPSRRRLHIGRAPSPRGSRRRRAAHQLLVVASYPARHLAGGKPDPNPSPPARQMGLGDSFPARHLGGSLPRGVCRAAHAGFCVFGEEALPLSSCPVRRVSARLGVPQHHAHHLGRRLLSHGMALLHTRQHIESHGDFKP